MVNWLVAGERKPEETVRLKTQGREEISDGRSAQVSPERTAKRIK